MFKAPEMEDFRPARGVTLADNRPIPLDAKSVQMFSRKHKFLRKN